MNISKRIRSEWPNWFKIWLFTLYNICALKLFVLAKCKMKFPSILWLCPLWSNSIITRTTAGQDFLSLSTGEGIGGRGKKSKDRKSFSSLSFPFPSWQWCMALAKWHGLSQMTQNTTETTTFWAEDKYLFWIRFVWPLCLSDHFLGVRFFPGLVCVWLCV